MRTSRSNSGQYGCPIVEMVATSRSDDRARFSVRRLGRLPPARTMASNSSSVSGITDRRLPRASSGQLASSGIVRRTSSGTNRFSGRTGATVTQSQRGSVGFEPGS